MTEFSPFTEILGDLDVTDLSEVTEANELKEGQTGLVLQGSGEEALVVGGFRLGLRLGKGTKVERLMAAIILPFGERAFLYPGYVNSQAPEIQFRDGLDARPVFAGQGLHYLVSSVLRGVPDIAHGRQRTQQRRAKTQEEK